MQRWNYDIIGTHLLVSIDTEEDCSLIFSEIESRLQSFEVRFSRFVEGNWLSELNTSRRGILDTDAKNMLTFALGMAQNTQ